MWTWLVASDRCGIPPEARSCHIVAGVFTPVLAKHSKSFSVIDCISVGLDRMQRNFEPMRKQVAAEKAPGLTAGMSRFEFNRSLVGSIRSGPIEVDLLSNPSHLRQVRVDPSSCRQLSQYWYFGALAEMTHHRFDPP